jgi:DNA primase
MPKTQFVDFKAVKAAITMEQVLGHYGLLDKFKRGADSLNGPCPIHKGSNPTQFRISVSKNIWNCFSECKHGGNVLDFIAEMEDVTIHAAALKAIEWFSLDPEAVSGERDEAPEAEETKSRPKPDVKTATRTATSPPPAEKAVPNPPLKFRLDKLERDHPYLVSERGLSQKTLIDFGVGYCGKGMMADRIAIPIHNLKGEVVAYAGRFIGEPPDENTQRYKLPPGFKKSQELFNCDRAFREPADKPLLIVEGFFDCMKIHDHGYKKVVALMGSTMSGAQEAIIRQHTKSDSHVIIMLDENESGIAGREDIALRLSKFCFVRMYQFPRPDMEPEHLTDHELADIVEGVA